MIDNSFRDRMIAGAMLLIALVMYAIFFAGMPLYADDLWYSVYLKSDRSLDAIIHTWKDHYLTDNARLSNILLVPLLLLPKWVSSLLTVAAWGWVLYAGAKMAGLRSDSVSGWTLWIALTCFILPWYDSMGALCYQFNYILPSALSLICISLFCNGKRHRPLTCLLCGLICGAWHEGFSLPIAGAMLLLYLTDSKTRTRDNTLMLIGLAAGIIWLLVSPGFRTRFQMVAGHESHIMFGSILMKTLLQPAMLLSLAAIALLPLTRRERLRNFFTPLNLILIISMAASYMMHLATLVSPRSGWWAEIAGLILLTEALRILPGGRTPAWLKCTATLLLGGLTLWRLITIDIYSIEIGRDFSTAMTEHEAAPGKAVFLDFPTELDSPLIAMMSPDFTIFLSPTYQRQHNNYLKGGNTAEQEFIVIPAALRQVTPQSGQPIAGNAGARMLDGRLFMPCDSTYTGEFPATVDFGIKQVSGVRMLYRPFISEADGRRYAYLYPWRQVIAARLGSIRSIDREDLP